MKILPCNAGSRKAWGCYASIVLPLICTAMWIQTHPQVARMLYLISGWLTWTFLEYFLHRFIMHDDNGRTDPHHHAEHHRHHHHPNEFRVSGWHRTVLIASGIAFLRLSWTSIPMTSLLAGFHLGLVSYTVSHRFLHRPIAAIILPRLSRHHLQHHCARPNSCFGVTVTWWDLLLGTGTRCERSIHPRAREFHVHGPRPSGTGARSIIVLAVCVLGQGELIAQDTLAVPRYRSWVQMMETNHVRSIRFHSTVDGSVRMRTVLDRVPGGEVCGEIQELPITDIRMLQFRRKGRVGRTLAITVPIGILAGSLLGMRSHDDTVWGIPSFNYVPFVVCTGAGIGLGFAIGSVRTTYRVDGSNKRYDHMRRSIDHYGE